MGKNIMKNYKWDAQEYEKYSQGQQKWARELIEFSWYDKSCHR